MKNILVISNKDKEQVEYQQVWECFVQKNSNFPFNFKSYQYFRDKKYCSYCIYFILTDCFLYSFIVKTGANFGVNYTIYRSIPSLCHSEMCALVVSDSNSMDDNLEISWGQLSSLTRTMPVSIYK